MRARTIFGIMAIVIVVSLLMSLADYSELQVQAEKEKEMEHNKTQIHKDGYNSCLEEMIKSISTTGYFILESDTHKFKIEVTETIVK